MKKKKKFHGLNFSIGKLLKIPLQYWQRKNCYYSQNGKIEISERTEKNCIGIRGNTFQFQWHWENTDWIWPKLTQSIHLYMCQSTDCYFNWLASGITWGANQKNNIVKTSSYIMNGRTQMKSIGKHVAH